MRLIRVLLVVAVLLPLTGCLIGIPYKWTWHAYPGRKLPNDQTALIKPCTSVCLSRFDGQELPTAFVPWDENYFPQAHYVRALPGIHEVEARRIVEALILRPPKYRYEGVTFNAEAGETYTVHWRGKKGVVHIWVDDRSGSVVGGEKPPEK